jgi:hypothetical protein
MRERVICRLEKKTLGALQYKQINAAGELIRRDKDGQVVGNMYLRKAAIRGRVPEKITVTIEY